MKKFSKEYYDYLNSPKWNFKRRQIAEKCNYRCQLCNKKMLKGFHIHHLTYENFGNEKLEDLMFLCPECHLIKIHNQRLKKREQKKEEKNKISKITDKEKELFLNKEYFLKNFDKLTPENKAILTTYLRKNYKEYFYNVYDLRYKKRTYIIN